MLFPFHGWLLLRWLDRILEVKISDKEDIKEESVLKGDKTRDY